ncbi:unnamed protein product [Prunus armeniaca]
MDLLPSMPFEMKTSRRFALTCPPFNAGMSILWTRKELKSRRLKRLWLKEDGAEGNATDEMVTDVVDQVGG